MYHVRLWFKGQRKSIQSYSKATTRICLCSLVSTYCKRCQFVGSCAERRAARWACGSRWDPTTSSWSLSHDTCYQMLHLPTLCARRDYLSVCTIQDIRHNGSVPFQNYFTYNTMPTRSHSLSIVIPSSTINARWYSYFVRVCFIWNQLPIDLLKIDNRNLFRHAVLKHFCNTF